MSDNKTTENNFNLLGIFSKFTLLYFLIKFILFPIANYANYYKEKMATPNITTPNITTPNPIIPDITFSDITLLVIVFLFQPQTSKIFESLDLSLQGGLQAKFKTLENTIEENKEKIEENKEKIEELNTQVQDYAKSYKLCQVAASWVDVKKHDWVKQIKNLDLSTYNEDLNSESKLKSFEEDILHYLELLADSLRNTMFLKISAVKPSINSNSSKLLYKKVLTYIRDIDEVKDISTEEFAQLKKYFDAIIGNL